MRIKSKHRKRKEGVKFRRNKIKINIIQNRLQYLLTKQFVMSNFKAYDSASLAIDVKKSVNKFLVSENKVNIDISAFVDPADNKNIIVNYSFNK